MSTGMVSVAALVVAVLALAFANGANDNFKGVATLLGSRMSDYRVAIWWATLTTLAGSIVSMLLAAELVRAFSGRGIVGPATADPWFLTCVGMAAATVLLATRLGMPISTTYALVGALVAAGFVHTGDRVSLGGLATGFVLPLLVSPFLAIVGTMGLYVAAHSARLTVGVRKELCVCAGAEVVATAPVHEPGVFGVVTRMPTLHPAQECRERYVGTIVTLIPVARILDALHFLSAEAVSFARGLNDAPKICGVLSVALTLGVFGLAETTSRAVALMLVGVVMAAGGLLAARRVGHTMSFGITGMNSGRALVGSVVTASLVITASLAGSPVSTTHVSTGSLFGIRAVRASGIGLGGPEIGLATLRSILLAWLLTLPTAAILGALFQ